MGRITHKAYRQRGGGRISPQVLTFNNSPLGNNPIRRVPEPPAPPQPDPKEVQNINQKQRY